GAEEVLHTREAPVPKSTGRIVDRQSHGCSHHQERTEGHDSRGGVEGDSSPELVVAEACEQSDERNARSEVVLEELALQGDPDELKGKHPQNEEEAFAFSIGTRVNGGRGDRSLREERGQAEEALTHGWKEHLAGAAILPAHGRVTRRELEARPGECRPASLGVEPKAGRQDRHEARQSDPEERRERLGPAETVRTSMSGQVIGAHDRACPERGLEYEGHAKEQTHAHVREVRAVTRPG